MMNTHVKNMPSDCPNKKTLSSVNKKIAPPLMIQRMPDTLKTSDVSQPVVQRVINLSGKSILPKSHIKFIVRIKDFMENDLKLPWRPSYSALLSRWLKSDEYRIEADDLNALAYNLYYHGKDESQWRDMKKVDFSSKEMMRGKLRRKQQRMAMTLRPSKVQTSKSARGLNQLNDDQLLRLNPGGVEESEFWKRNKDGSLTVLKKRRIDESGEARVVAAGDASNPSYVVYKDGVQVGHRYVGSTSGVNHSKQRTYGSKKDREGYEYKGSGLVDGHSIQAQDDQVILGPYQSETSHWKTETQTQSGGVGPVYDDSKYLPTGPTDTRFIETHPYNYYWENQEQGKHFRQKGIEAPAKKDHTSFLHLNTYTGDYFNPNAGSAKGNKYPVPSQIDYLLDDGVGKQEHLIADNRPVADYSHPSGYNATTHRYPDIVGEPSHTKNTSLGGVKVSEHLDKARQTDTSQFPKATVLHPHDSSFDFMPSDRHDDDDYFSPPPSPYHTAQNLEEDEESLMGDQRDFADMMRGEYLVHDAKYDPVKDKTILSRTGFKESDVSDWHLDKSKFEKFKVSSDVATEPIVSGEAYSPTAHQNAQLLKEGVSLQWVPPDGYCMFHAVGLVTGQTGEMVRQKVLDAIKTDSGVQHWISNNHGMSLSVAEHTIRNIGELWSSSLANVVIHLIALSLKEGFTIIIDQQPLLLINGGGKYLVKVSKPNEHYHGAK